MATFMATFLSCVLCAHLLCHGSLAQLPMGQGQQPYPARRLWEQSECRVERLQAVEPSRRVQCEAGVMEYWDQNDEQFQCAGVAPFRTTIQPGGLLLPYFSNSPRLIYVVQGSGISGLVIPGCPETYQSFQQFHQLEERGPEQRFRDQHQRIHHFRQGDIVAEPAGMAAWFYNHGDTPVVTITVADTSSHANQLDPRLRMFQLAGQQRREPYGRQAGASGEEETSGNIFSGFDVEMLAEAFGVSRETAMKLQSRDDRRGNIVRVEMGLQVLRPEQTRSYEPVEEEKEHRRRGANGLEEAFCTARYRENIGDARRADVYNPRAGRMTTLNSQKLLILRSIQMSVERGVLHRNAHFVPHWNINAHSILYVLRGRCRLQISGPLQASARFDREVRQGQMVVIPQNFAVTALAVSTENFEWVSFKTNDNAMVSPLAGKASIFRGLPDAVIQNSYRISREEARRIKYNRGEELLLLQPTAQGVRASA
ncbi:hypothetical protein Taro_003978 [Colocasia esculenta]|uniref:Cupin type-1 domain-containing protein n=1 Tax=Colocasia esculenta TaxID=4460 RepID=A0A843TQD1_COLES|nr:hypothetical protein [Colocasia esculenta]